MLSEHLKSWRAKVLNLKMCIHEQESLKIFLNGSQYPAKNPRSNTPLSPHPHLPRWHEVKNIGVNGLNTGTHYPDHELTAPANNRTHTAIIGLFYIRSLHVFTLGFSSAKGHFVFKNNNAI
jgi:hypothetical protein